MCLPNAAAVWISGLLLALLMPVASATGVYRWVDADGRVHFSDRPQQQNAEKLQLNVQASNWQPMNIRITQQGSLQNNDDQLDLKRIQRDVNTIYRFYAQVLYFDFLRNVPVNIHLLGNQQEYLQYVQQVADWDARNTLGVYISSQHTIVVYLHDKKIGGLNSTYATIRHEVSHAILHSLAGRIPDWLNEGMAEQMETISRSNDAFIIRSHKGNKRRFLARHQQAMPVLKFVEVRSDA